ncbi:MAG: excisionase family DNA-binding protein [Steroidobacteraceae bacterium]
MAKQVLTTADAAKLLGISVRTAQLLIESGVLNSWKTPGGHRRVYLADVLAYITPNPHSSAFVSARAILLASPERHALFEPLLGTVSECVVEPHTDVYFAAFAIGSRLPAAVIVDMHDSHADRLAFLHRLAAHPELGTTRFIAVSDDDAAILQESPLEQTERMLVTTPNELPLAIRAALTPSSTHPQSMQDPLFFPIAANESQRLQAVERSGLLATPAEPAFDRLTWLASHNLKMPVSLMTLLTSTQQHFKSRVGLEIEQTPRSWAICNHTILQKQVYAVANLSSTPAFSTNPAVAGDPHFRFYAGAPVFDPDGFALGSICVMDYEPHELDAGQAKTLLALAAMASDEVRLRATTRSLRAAR